MSRLALCLSTLLVLSALVFAQPQAKFKKGDRPVFMSAQRLAFLCADWNAINPGGKHPRDNDVLDVSPKEIIRGSACDAYIAGVEDAGFDSYGSKYHPVPAALDYMKPLVDTFIKRVADHPEEQDLAASTVLHEAEKTVADAEGANK